MWSWYDGNTVYSTDLRAKVALKWQVPADFPLWLPLDQIWSEAESCHVRLLSVMKSLISHHYLSMFGWNTEIFAPSLSLHISRCAHFSWNPSCKTGIFYYPPFKTIILAREHLCYDLSHEIFIREVRHEILRGPGKGGQLQYEGVERCVIVAVNISIAFCHAPLSTANLKSAQKTWSAFVSESHEMSALSSSTTWG
jgi:hypothetical protein